MIDATVAVAVARLRSGGLVAFPTETVYGLGADALDARAVARVFLLKGRPPLNPLIVHVQDAAVARGVTRSWPELAEYLTRRFWPGPLTLVLPKAVVVPPIVTAGGDTVAVRCPDHPLALALLAAFGGPLVGPSANRSGRVSPTRAEHVRASFGGDEVFVLDGGPCRSGIESTVLSLVESPPRILRPGALPAEDLGIDLASNDDSDRLEDDEHPISPGRLSSHYAPERRVVLFRPGDWPGILRGQSGWCVVLSLSPRREVPLPHVGILMPSDPASYAARLYDALREADALKPTGILVETPECTRGIWAAIHDRLRRAAGSR